MVPIDDHDFFVAAASAAGALIGLLFVALSVWREREEERRVIEFHRLRASAALTVFTNALSVSLFALVPGTDLGIVVAVLGVVGLAFVVASGLRLVQLMREKVAIRARDLVFLVGGAVLFVFELLAGLALQARPHDPSRVESVAEIVIFSLLFGIGRSWELIGGPHVGVIHEVTDILRKPASAPASESAPGDEPALPSESSPTPNLESAAEPEYGFDGEPEN